MQSSRDSSIWRSLAVAFGDGVAFGVGVKLAQGPNRPAAGAPPAEAPAIAPYIDRLEEIEQRIHAIEHAPAGPAPAPAPFDQKVLEAVVNALDARLHEQAGQVERRLTELEAKLAIELKSLHQQDHSIVTGLQGRMEEVHGQYNEHVIAIRDAVAQDMDILYGQIAQLRQDYAASTGAVLEAKIAERIAATLTSQMEARLESMEARLQLEVVGAVDRASVEVASAATSRIDQQLAPIHAALVEKDREIGELRQRLADNEQTVLDLILTIGQMCRQVAERISPPVAAAPPSDDISSGDDGPSAGAAADPPSAPSPEEPTPDADPHLPIMAAAVPVNGDTNGHSHEPLPDSLPIAAVQRPSRLWRIPLVSSFLILAAGSLSLLK